MIIISGMSKLSNSRRTIRLITLVATVLAAAMSVPFALRAGALTSTPEMVKEIGNDPNLWDDMSVGQRSKIFMDGDVAYFAARSTHNGSPDGDGLWKSDGTASGTVQIASATQLGGSGINNFVKMGNDIYFTVIGSSGAGTLVKKYDGSAVTTAVDRAGVRNVVGSGTASDFVIYSSFLWRAGGYVYFVATVNPLTPTWDLFRYDGNTVSRASQLEQSNYQDFGPVFELDGTTYYFSYKANATAGQEYAFDTIPSTGRRGTTVRLAGDSADIAHYAPSDPVIISGAPDRAYFLMNTGSPEGSTQIVTFDGTTVTPVTEGASRIRYASYPTVVGNRVYFTGSNNDGDFMWYTSATTATKIEKPTGGSSWNIPSYTSKVFGSLNDSIYLFIHRGPTNLELWRTDGTSAGTQMLADLGLGTNSSTSSVGWLYAAQGEMFFVSVDNGTTVVRKTDGTVSGTSAAGGLSANVTVPSEFAQGLTTVFFYAQTTGSGIELHGVIPSGGAPSQNPNNGNSSPNNGNTNNGGGTTSGGNTSSSSTTSGLPSATELSGFKTVELVPSGSVNAGQSFDVSASGFQASEDVNAYLQGSSTSIGVSKASANGTATVSVKIPKNVSGKKTLYLFGKSSRHGVKQSITVQGTLTELPATGAQPLLLLWIAAAVMFGGVGLRRLGFTIRSRPTNES